MNIVNNQDEILDHVEIFLEGLELGSAEEMEKGREIVKKADTFLAILSEDINIFVPSSFVGYKDLTLESFNPLKHVESEVIPVISKILGSTPKIDKVMDELFLDFCDEIEINRNDVGLSREYWIMKNI